MQSVEQNYGDGSGRSVEFERVGKASRTGEDELPVVDVVPVDADVGAKPASGGFAHLPGTVDKRHLPMVRKMFDQQGIVYPRQLHDRPLSISSSNSHDYCTIYPNLVAVVPASGTSPLRVEGAFRKTGIRAAVAPGARQRGECLSLQFLRAAQPEPARSGIPDWRASGRDGRQTGRTGRSTATGDSRAITG